MSPVYVVSQSRAAEPHINSDTFGLSDDRPTPRRVCPSLISTRQCSWSGGNPGTPNVLFHRNGSANEGLPDRSYARPGWGIGHSNDYVPYPETSASTRKMKLLAIESAFVTVKPAHGQLKP